MRTSATCQDLTSPSPRHGTPFGRFGQATAGLFGRLAAMHRTALQRRDLRDLDDRTLSDIGISRADVERETGRHFWDVDL